MPKKPLPEGGVNSKGQKRFTDPTTGKDRYIDMKEGRVKGPRGLPVKGNVIKFNINSKDVLDLCKDEYESAKKALYTGVDKLAKAAETHLIELVKTELNPHHAICLWVVVKKKKI